jgi:Domain of unknown function (DUF6134)
MNKVYSVLIRRFSFDHLGRRLSSAVFGVVAAAAVAAWPCGASAQTVRDMVYKVVHATYGDIGTYANQVITSGDTTTVKTTVHLAVKVLGIVMHRENDERTEQWRNHRLVAFHSVTDKNGTTVVVDGRADGDKFLITSPRGTFTAPATVQPANPWSLACLRSTTMMRVDTGKVEPVRVLGGQAATVNVDGTSVATREYQIDSGQKYRIWFNQQGIPVKFTVDDDSGKVTFSLIR